VLGYKRPGGWVRTPPLSFSPTLTPSLSPNFHLSTFPTKALRKTSLCKTLAQTKSSGANNPDEPEEVHEHEEGEGEPDVPQEQPRVEDADTPYLDLEGDWEMQAYNHVKNCVFPHTPLHDPSFSKR